MARKITTLFMRDDSINLLVVKGRRVEKWASLSLEPELVSQGLILDETQVADRIKELFKLEGVSKKKVIVGLSGLDSLYRMITLPEMPEAILTEAVRREAGRVLPVPLDEVYLSYQLIPARKGETRVFLAVFPRNRVDVLLRTMHQAGLEPYVMDLAPLALSRIPNEPRAIIVNARLDHLGIMVIADRIPQLIRTVSLPSEVESLSEKLSAITEELSRTVTFYNSSHLENPLDSTVPVFVCGEPAEAPEAWQSIAGSLNSPVSPLPSPVEYLEGFPVNEFMVNIGLALKELLSEKEEANFSLVNFNALPEVYQPKVLPKTRIIAPVGIAVGIGLLVYMGFLVQNSIADTTELRSELALTESHIAQQHGEIAILEEQIEQVGTQIESVAAETELVAAEIEPVEATTDVFRTTFTSLEEVREEVNADLAQVVILTQGTVELTGVNHGGSSVTVNGIAPHESDIFRYARDLRSGGRFPLVIISSIAEYTKKVEEEEIKAFSFVFLLK